MSLPRPVYRGGLYLVTRRTSERRFFLKPSKKLNRTLEYILAVVARRTGVRVHALVVMSNHWHCVCSDPEGRMPEFLRDVHALIAKCINTALGRWENLWSSEQTSLVRLEGQADILDKIVYTMTNPVDAYLVERGANWPGLRTSWPEKRRPVPRPRGFFREGGDMPEEATLELTRPPGFGDLGDDELNEKLLAATSRREEEIRARAQREGIRFLGRRQVRDQSPYDHPFSKEPRRQISPRVASKNKWRRIEALRRLEDFIEAYRAAYAQWRRGGVLVLFPRGTYLLRVQAGVPCAPG